MNNDLYKRSIISLKPTILVVDDDSVTLAMLEAQLRASGYPVVLASDGVEAMHILQENPVRIVLSDWLMPEMDGLELCRTIKAIPNAPFVHFIMLTMQSDTDRLVEAFDAGVNDFLAKPCEHAELIARLHAGARMIELESAMLRREKLTKRLNDRLQRVNNRLQYMASTDPLTGLFNRREAMARLRVQWLAAERYGQDLCVAMIDVDRFKQYNDSEGHGAGDELLRTIATTLTTSLREVDTIARVGGDEFLVIMPYTSVLAAIGALNRVQRLVQSETKNSVTISIGVAGKSDKMDGIESMIRAADEALYAEKKDGKNVIRQDGQHPIAPA